MDKRVLVNLGCGAVAHPDWMNFDLEPTVPFARVFDVRQRLPLATDSVDMCYSSHLLEHLTAPECTAFLQEQRRVLKPQCVIRIAVPDLGWLCRRFADLQERALVGDAVAEFKLEYTYLELFDQATRTVPGGDLYTAWLRCPPEHATFVESRAGDEFCSTIARRGTKGRRTASLLRSGGWRRAWAQLRQRGVEATALLLLGRNGARAVREGFFRLSGEVHRVMYDEVRLARRLVAAGFRDPQRMTATESRLSGFATYNLDSEDGRTRKPDSLFIEALA